MRDELRGLALCALVLLVMYLVGTGILEMGKAILGGLQ